MNRVIGVVPVKTVMFIVVAAAVMTLAAFAAQAALTAETLPGLRVGPAPAREEAAPAIDQSGLEIDLKEAVRSQTSALAGEASAPDASGLEADLKEVVRSQSAALAADESGLESELKAIIRSQSGSGPQE